MRDFDVPPPRRSPDVLPTAPVDLPRRVPQPRGVRTAYFGGTRDQVARVRGWCLHGLRMPAHRAFPVLVVLSELVTNAVVHSASGGRYGRVRVSMESLPGQVLLVSVTDDGPRALCPVTVPALADAPATRTPCAACGWWPRWRRSGGGPEPPAVR
ncbi:ATP-binding protein [Nocardiopsis sp. CNR-923]|uniref:ATP-binding protein n=1 Tax=Nocardiopsis sp. CNR-923 TaxID=1904965 RepID=UPI0021CCBDE6|nr:ATP-binding protein [Nocardiopsis sp. CNR-923]